MAARTRRAALPKRSTKKAPKKTPEQRAADASSLALQVKVHPPTEMEADTLQALRGINRRLPFSVVKDVAKRLEGVKISHKKLEEVLERVADRYDNHLIDANESCGIVSAQSIGEPGTQMSLPYGERVVVSERGRVRIAPIGEIVDALMTRYPGGREGPTEWCDLPGDASIEVPSLSGDGKIAWKAVRAVSRHTCHDRLLRLLTRTGREITATSNHSFVTRRGGRVVPVSGGELRPGDRIPVMRRWTIGPVEPQVDLGEVLPREEYWYGSELTKARALGPDWRKGYGRDFVVPAGLEALGRYMHGRAEIHIEDGFVYPFQNHSRARLPEGLPLDAALGWLVGAYLSEGWAARWYVNISNTDERFLQRTRAVAEGYGIGHGEFDNGRGFALGHDLHLRSVVLSALLRTTCGSGSADKRIPDFALSASDTFVGALLRAYFEGDGNVTVARGAIRASSNSKVLMDDIALLLARFGILASKGRQGKQYTVWIPWRYAKVFRETIGFESEAKRVSLDSLCEHPGARYTYDALDMVCGYGTILWDLARRLGLPTRYVNNFTRRQRIGRATLSRYVSLFEARARERGIDVGEELGRLRALADEDVTWDEILSINEVDAPSQPVYDLSVPGLETFTTAEGVVTHNTMRTFHYAGVAEMNVTLGLPRLIEIVDARRVPSTPVMEIHVKPGENQLEKIKKHAHEIEVTTLQDVAEVETDIINMRAVAYPNEHRMKVKGISWEDLERALKRLKQEKVNRSRPDGTTEEVDAFVMVADQPSFKRLQRMVELLRETKIKGIDGIRRAIIRRKGDGYVLYSEGSNLSAILELPFVDPAKTTTNNIMEIYEVLGVEAARNAIVKEASETLGEQGLTVDIRHIMLVSDIMTNDGDVKAIGRHGISGRKSSVLARAAFEITAHHLLRAAVSGEVDYLDGVAENVIVGQPVTLGTGAVNLVFAPPKGVKPVIRPPPPKPTETPPEEPAEEEPEPAEATGG